MLGIDAYLITSNGARVHAPGDECVYARNLDSAAVHRLVQPDLAGGNGRVIVNLFADDAWLIDRHAPELLVFHQDSGFKCEVMDLREHDGEYIAKVLYMLYISYRRSGRSEGNRREFGARIRRFALSHVFAAGLSGSDDVGRV